MASNETLAAAAIACLSLLGCAGSRASANSAPAAPEPASTRASAFVSSPSPTRATPDASAQGAAANAPSAAVTSTAAPASAAVEAPSAGALTPAADAQSLPAVSVTSVGMHIGGGPNDAADKQPFEAALAAHFGDFLRCYRLVSEPGKSGTFGVDLHIERAGGRPRVEQPRTLLGTEAFRTCMLSAFESVEFPRLKKPTVVSYSIRFNVEAAPIGAH